MPLFYNKKGGLCTFGELSSFTVLHNNGWQSVTSNYRDKTNQGINISSKSKFEKVSGIILLLPFQDWSSTDDISGLFCPTIGDGLGEWRIEDDPIHVKKVLLFLEQFHSLLWIIAGSDDLTSFMRFVCLSPFLVFNFWNSSKLNQIDKITRKGLKK